MADDTSTPKPGKPPQAPWARYGSALHGAGGRKLAFDELPRLAPYHGWPL